MALLTTSCTSALEMAAILANVEPGDEIIMPSYTFVSTANAFVLRGGVPVFIDIEPDTSNMDPARVEAAITKRTKAVAPVHYAGVAADMDPILAIAKEHSLLVIEDAAQGLMASYKGRPLGGIGHLGATSFHETKNIISGEGGAIFVNDPQLRERAEVIREKGTNRSRFFRGQVDKYTWIDIGSSYLPSELNAAFLYAQMLEAEVITQRRLSLWEKYHAAFCDIERSGKARRPVIPAWAKHNAHMYYLLLPDMKKRDAFIGKMREKGIHTVFHYVPLHSSPAGGKYGRANWELAVTDDISGRLVRLPLWLGLEPHMDYIIGNVIDIATHL